MKFCYLAISTLLIGLSFSGCNPQEEPATEINDLWLTESVLTEGNVSSIRQLSITLYGHIGEPIEISYEIKEGSARFDADLKSGSGTIEIAPGATDFTIPVEIIGDEFFEMSESFLIELVFRGRTFSFMPTIIDTDLIEPILEDEDGFISAEEHPSMQIIWQDEFNGTQLNTLYWSNELGNGCSVGNCGWGNNELENYTASEDNLKLENGKLIITAVNTGGGYTSARIKTQAKVKPTFGRIDVRAKLPKGKGIWPAIWMLGETITTVGWPACGEIDIMELVGHEPAKSHGTVHFDQGGYRTSTGSKSLTTGDFSESFHVFSLVWEKNKITWYIDNESFKTFSHEESEFNQPQFFIMNVAVGGNWPGSPDGTTVFPQSMVVDYIRVFQ